jgi:hypothetical protein
VSEVRPPRRLRFARRAGGQLALLSRASPLGAWLRLPLAGLGRPLGARASEHLALAHLAGRDPKVGDGSLDSVSQSVLGLLDTCLFLEHAHGDNDTLRAKVA